MAVVRHPLPGSVPNFENRVDGVPAPPLVHERVTALISVLDADWARVNASGAPDFLKARINQTIVILQQTLGARPNNLTIDEWVAFFGPQFRILLDDLGQALGTSHAEEGICVYRHGCIPSTEEHCTGLGGTFIVGIPCPQ